MGHEKRFEHVTTFNDDNSLIISVANYTLRTEGANLHYRCCTVMLAEQPTSLG